MLLREQLYNFFRKTCVGLLLFLYSLSLIVPHSSAYFSKELRHKSDVKSTGERIKIATSLFTSPAEAGITQRINVVHVLDNFILRSAEYEIASRLNARFEGPNWLKTDLHHPGDQWHPSIVIALRKLII